MEQQLEGRVFEAGEHVLAVACEGRERVARRLRHRSRRLGAGLESGMRPVHHGLQAPLDALVREHGRGEHDASRMGLRERSPEVALAVPPLARRVAQVGLPVEQLHLPAVDPQPEGDHGDPDDQVGVAEERVLVRVPADGVVEVHDLDAHDLPQLAGDRLDRLVAERLQRPLHLRHDRDGAQPALVGVATQFGHRDLAHIVLSRLVPCGCSGPLVWNRVHLKVLPQQSGEIPCGFAHGPRCESASEYKVLSCSARPYEARCGHLSPMNWKHSSEVLKVGTSSSFE